MLHAPKIYDIQIMNQINKKKCGGMAQRPVFTVSHDCLRHFLEENETHKDSETEQVGRAVTV
jgi:hypothetical protein